MIRHPAANCSRVATADDENSQLVWGLCGVWVGVKGIVVIILLLKCCGERWAKLRFREGSMWDLGWKYLLSWPRGSFCPRQEWGVLRHLWGIKGQEALQKHARSNLRSLTMKGLLGQGYSLGNRRPRGGPETYSIQPLQSEGEGP